MSQSGANFESLDEDGNVVKKSALGINKKNSGSNQIMYLNMKQIMD